MENIKVSKHSKIKKNHNFFYKFKNYIEYGNIDILFFGTIFQKKLNFLNIKMAIKNIKINKFIRNSNQLSILNINRENTVDKLFSS